MDALVVPHSEQMAVAADKILRLSNDGAFQNGVIIRVGGDDFQCAWNGNDLGEGANLTGDFRRFARLERERANRFFHDRQPHRPGHFVPWLR